MALREVLSAQAGSAAVVAPTSDARIGSSIVCRQETHVPTGAKQMDIDLNMNFAAEEGLSDMKDQKGVIHQPVHDIGMEKSCVTQRTVKLEAKQEQDCHEAGFQQVKESKTIVKPEWDLNVEVKSEVDAKMNDKESWNLVDRAVLCQMPEESRAVKCIRAAEQAWAANLEFLQDCTIRLLCILALDR